MKDSANYIPVGCGVLAARHPGSNRHLFSGEQNLTGMPHGRVFPFMEMM
ncbi:hypothetical protein ABQE57_22225 [Mycolicibacterium elephantis]